MIVHVDVVKEDKTGFWDAVVDRQRGLMASGPSCEEAVSKSKAAFLSFLAEEILSGRLKQAPDALCFVTKVAVSEAGTSSKVTAPAEQVPHPVVEVPPGAGGEVALSPPTSN